MGEVHLASSQGAAGFEKLVALKLLASEHMADRRRLQSLLREAMIGVRLDHENVVQVLDFGEENGTYFIAMEYVRGFNLSDIIAHERVSGHAMPVRATVCVARAMARALDYVHQFGDRDGGSLGLVHGDVSPGNVLVAADGRIKLSDFGVAALARESSRGYPMAGKLPYMPPESMEGASRVQAWDVYALGAVLYEALTGKRAFPGERMAEVCQSMERGPVPIDRIRSDCPRPVQDVVMRAIAREPSARFPSAAALRRALDEVYPRQVDDVDHLRVYLDDVYNDDAFVALHGKLPTTGGFRTTLDLAPFIARALEAESAPTAIGNTPTQSALRFGLSPALGPDLAREAGDRLSRYMRRQLDRDVRIAVLIDYRALVEAIARGELDIAWMPPFAYVAAADANAGALVVARRHGKSAYESALVVRAESRLQSIEELAGKSAAWVDRDSASGYLFAAAEIMRRLRSVDDALGKQHFFGSHREVCNAVVNGWADVGATYVHRDGTGRVVSSGWLDALGDRASELRPIAYSAPIPGDNIAHRPDMDELERAAIANAFRSMSECEEGRALLSEIFHADSFANADPAMYEPVRSRMRLL